MNTPERLRLGELLHVASRLPAAARASFLARAEPRRNALRAEAESLLAHDAGGELLPAALRGPLALGPYSALEPIGEAPPARLYRARCGAGAALVAVAGPGPAAARVADALALQARRQRALRIPELARLRDAGATADGLLYAGFEPVEGVPLTELADVLRLSLCERVALLEEAARIVERAHAAGLVPFGLLPWSVLGTWSGEGARVALIAIDAWPLLALLEPERGARPELLAAIETSAPEALRGAERGVPADVFALGALLYESATGTPPLGLRRLAGRRTLREALRTAGGMSPPTASARVAALGTKADLVARARSCDVRGLERELAEGLDAILARALAVDPESRPASAGALADELEAWRAGRSSLLARTLGRLRRQPPSA